MFSHSNHFHEKNSSHLDLIFEASLKEDIVKLQTLLEVYKFEDNVRNLLEALQEKYLFQLRRIVYQIGALESLNMLQAKRFFSFNAFNMMLSKLDSDEIELNYSKGKLFGCAFGGFEGLVYSKLESQKSTYEDDSSDTDDDYYEILFRESALGFARGGHQQKAYRLLDFVRREHPKNAVDIFGCLGQGFAHSKLFSECYKLIPIFQADQLCRGSDYLFWSVAIGLGCSGNLDESQHFVEYIKKNYPEQIRMVLESIASGLAGNGYQHEAYQFLTYVHNKYADQAQNILEVIASIGVRIDRNIKNHIVLSSLVKMDAPEGRIACMDQLKLLDEKIICHQDKLLSQATKANQLLKKCKVSPDQAIGMSICELQIWFLQGIQLLANGKLHFSTFRIIASFISPLSEQDCRNLEVSIYKQHMSSTFNLYYKNSGFFGVLKDEHALYLANECLTRISKNELNALIKNESYEIFRIK